MRSAFLLYRFNPKAPNAVIKSLHVHAYHCARTCYLGCLITRIRKCILLVDVVEYPDADYSPFPTCSQPFRSARVDCLGDGAHAMVGWLLILIQSNF